MVSMPEDAAQHSIKNLSIATRTTLPSTEIATRGTLQHGAPHLAVQDAKAQPAATASNQQQPESRIHEKNPAEEDRRSEAAFKAVVEAAHGSKVVDTFDLSHTVATQMAPPAVGAPVEDLLEFLQQQLNAVGMETPILDGLLLLGSSGHQRLQGGTVFARPD